MQKHAVIIASACAVIFLVSCQTAPDETKLISGTSPPPLPSWTKAKSNSDASPTQIKIESKLIEIQYEPGATQIPSKPYQKELNKAQLASYLRSKAQQKGADIMTSPSVATPAGQLATVEIIKEFTYPISANHKQFKTENLGVIQHYRVAGNYHDQMKLITLNALARVKEIEGFENSKSSTPKPIFKERRFDKKVTLWGGNTVVFGGLMTDSQRQIEDQTPVLSSLPIFGSLFTKKSTQHHKTELIFLVTATRITPTGETITEVPERLPPPHLR